MTRQRLAELVRSPPVTRLALPWLCFALVSAWVAWPAWVGPARIIAGPPGDNLYCVWLIGWFQRALVELHVNPWFVPFHDYPFGWPVAYSESSLSNVLIALPFSMAAGPVVAYNATLFLSFVLSGWITYLWADALLHDQRAALVAGTVFAIAPFRLAHLNGHITLMGTHWLALHFFGLTTLLTAKGRSWKGVLAAGLGLGLAALSSMYFLYMTLVVSAAVVVGYLAFFGWRRAAERAFWTRIAAVGVVALPLVLVAIAPYLALAGAGAANHRPLAEVDVWSASITDFLLPAPTHFLWGRWLESWVRRPLWIEQYIYVGALPIILALVALLPRKAGARLGSRETKWFAAVVAVSAMLAMGTSLHWLGRPIHVRVPAFLASHNEVLGLGHIPLPNYVLYKYLPFYDGMRVWCRYGVYVVLFGGLLAAAGYSRLTAGIGRTWVANLLLVAAIGAVAVDYRVNLPTTTVTPRAVDAWLAGAPGGGSVAQFPIEQSMDPDYVLGSLEHRKPLLGMFYGGYLPRDFATLLPALATFPSEASMRVLRGRGVGYVVVDASRYPAWTPEQRVSPVAGLALEAEVGRYLVYRMTPP